MTSEKVADTLLLALLFPAYITVVVMLLVLTPTRARRQSLLESLSVLTKKHYLYQYFLT